MKRAGGQCARTAKETSELCETTISKARQMVDFGMEIKSTLDDLSGGGGSGHSARSVIDASRFETIQELISGDKMKAAWNLATEMDDLALNCVNQSIKMIDSIEQGIETLPDIFENRIDQNMEQAKLEGSKESDPQLRDITPDVEELQLTVKNIEQVNLFTVMKSGKDAFKNLTSKGEICYELFTTIGNFAKDVTAVADAIKNFQIGTMIGKVKGLIRDIWRCLRLSDLIREFAQAVKKLIQWIISLFKSVSERLATIWGALANAKNCLKEIIQHVLDSMKLCDDAKSKSIMLIDTCGEVQGHLRNITTINKDSIRSIKDLADGDEIQTMIDIAKNMDDIILNAVKKVIQMIKKVTQGFKELPDVIKEGIPEDAGTQEDDPDPANVDDDVNELVTSRGAIEEANALEAIQQSSNGFSNVLNKVSKCQDMIVSSRSFAENCNTTIDSFMGVWDLEVAMNHLIEMKRLVKLGEMMEQFAREILKLVKAVIDVMKPVMDKIRNIDLIPDKLEDAVENIGDALKDAGLDGRRIKKFGKKLGKFF